MGGVMKELRSFMHFDTVLARRRQSISFNKLPGNRPNTVELDSNGTNRNPTKNMSKLPPWLI
jgi:hypothetical protein